MAATFLGGEMERLFVRILNLSLVILGFVTLAGTVVILILLALTAAPLMSANTQAHQLHVAYVPLSQVSGSTPSSNDLLSSPASSEFPTYLTRICAAREALVRILSKGQLHVDQQNCRAEVAAEYSGDRQQNYFTQETRYLEAAAKDPQLTIKYPPSADKLTILREVSKIQEAFTKKFDAQAQADDARLQNENARIMLGKAYATTLVTAALATFLAFLIIAFLIVAIRIEKHIGTISNKMSKVV